MSNTTIEIREIRPEDNPQIEAVIREVFIEYGLPLVGTAYADQETPQMFESYDKENEVYYVVVMDGKVEGGGGLKPLHGMEDEVFEIQKMYFSNRLRGKGFGKQLFERCLLKGKSLGFSRAYLETIPVLKEAIHIYESNGFTHLKGPLGSTGHFNCGIWMEKKL
ncbi:GNAT family N-acetyltransferase [Olleya sp. Bg11-27]|uniref:GNAT family N-acetyltransferase n=1 Tax=Olleya sp. Bg11-27 TaxID=2058135 RepID=UPI000C302772|nr:GNAT family N-acetyltransferase [Olleya sp. Bg11-27]AUC76037.1 GNAT family N-acetyltransferase [Olleya sp. Bg11-27]